MPEDWIAIAAEVSATLLDVGFTATLTRPALPATPWSTTPPTEQAWTVSAMETGAKVIYDQAGLMPRTVRSLMISAGAAPKMGDTITLSDGAHEITWISPEQPGGVPLYFEIGVAI